MIGRPHVRVVLARVHECPADAIVHVVGSRLSPSRPDELLRTAGPDLQRELRDLQAHRVIARDERAVVTTAGLLPARWLVHARVPAYRVGEDRDYLLSRVTRSVLVAADEVGARSVATPLLGGTGPYWPLDDAIRIACGTLVTTPTSVTEVTIAVATPAALERIAEALAREPGN